MKINFNQPILDLTGKNSVKDPDGGTVTLGSACMTALLYLHPDEQGLSGIEKAERFAVAMKIAAAGEGEADVSAEDIVKVKLVVGKLYNPLVVGRAYSLLDA